jgi:bifunctional DNA-binding transcriptional regulator/antitoxin component of YhaV-PrlF toxin-antitoxin module
MKPAKPKRPAAARRPRRKFSRLGLRIRLPKTWRVTVTKSGAVILPREVLAQIGFWEGDELEMCVRHFAGRKFISLEVRPHGLTPAEIQKAARRALRGISQARKAERLVPFATQAANVPPKARQEKVQQVKASKSKRPAAARQRRRLERDLPRRLVSLNQFRNATISDKAIVEAVQSANGSGKLRK